MRTRGGVWSDLAVWAHRADPRTWDWASPLVLAAVASGLIVPAGAARGCVEDLRLTRQDAAERASFHEAERAERHASARAAERDEREARRHHEAELARHAAEAARSATRRDAEVMAAAARRTGRPADASAVNRAAGARADAASARPGVRGNSGPPAAARCRTRGHRPRHRHARRTGHAAVRRAEADGRDCRPPPLRPRRRSASCPGDVADAARPAASAPPAAARIATLISQRFVMTPRRAGTPRRANRG